MDKKAKKPIVAFESAVHWEKWLEEYQAKSDGIWMCLHKKDSGLASVNYAEALDVALCYGWIDGQKKSLNKTSWLQKFTPRRPKSGWSKVNTGHVERLIATGKMQRAGLVQVEAAKQDGRWDRAYSSQSTATIPEDFLKLVNKNKAAKKFFETLSKSKLYSIIYRLETAKKPETRANRIKKIMEMLERGESF